MKYSKVIDGRFIERPNRFIALVDIKGSTEPVHVKNTGRCRELLVPGCTVYLSVADNPDRKTKYDLIAVQKGSMLINMDSQIPNDVAEEWLRSGALFSENALIRREVTYGKSRFDFYIEDGTRKAFLEVKGCTLEKDGVALFPDAPTERGIKHLNELRACLNAGYEAYVLIVIQMKGCKRFMPNDETHKAFGEAMRATADAGVNIIAMDCEVEPDSISISERIPVEI